MVPEMNLNEMDRRFLSSNHVLGTLLIADAFFYRTPPRTSHPARSLADRHPHTQYACRFWLEHLRSSHPNR